MKVYHKAFFKKIEMNCFSVLCFISLEKSLEFIDRRFMADVHLGFILPIKLTFSTKMTYGVWFN